MKSMTFFNNKGGVGKTTLLCNTAAYLSKELNYSVLIIDADPQCNATQYMFDDSQLIKLYEETSTQTVYSVVRPLAAGKGYSKHVHITRSERFGVDVVPGDPRLALTEDLLARDWAAAIGSDVRGIRTTLLFNELLERCAEYDIVIFDVGPALGSINRAVLLATDCFLSPMSIDIFSVKAIENISEWLRRWQKQWHTALSNLESDADVPAKTDRNLTYLGYVSQQYLAKRDKLGSKRAVAAYDKIMNQFDGVIAQKLIPVTNQMPQRSSFHIGSIPNLHSLVPMSQTSRSPVFDLRSADGVRGAHFTKVKESREIFGTVAKGIVERVFPNVH